MIYTDEYINKRAARESRKLHPDDPVARRKSFEKMVRRAKWVRERYDLATPS